MSAHDNPDHPLDLRVLPPVEWREGAWAHRNRLDRLVGPYLQRRAAGTTHPVIDFLFTYVGAATTLDHAELMLRLVRLRGYLVEEVEKGQRPIV
ncbi:hypothetical protein [Nocardia asteroides]|uniref:hypothetical protein n=1 Tax=Nocardia asteroides TaxID=1824 RepID=UPI003F4D3871